MAAEIAPARKIKRLSTLYVPHQDRMRLTAEMESGDVQVLWMTQRLLGLALAPFEGYFGTTAPPSAEQKARRTTANLLDKVSGKAGPAVASLTVGCEWLIDTVDLRFGQPLHFVFKGQEGREVHMDMDALHLRQWLGILHRKCAKAGWPETLWPASVVAGLE